MKKPPRPLPSLSILNDLFRYDPETGVLTNKKTRRYDSREGAEAGFSCGGYRHVCVNGETFSAHRLIWLMHYGDSPEGWVDHVNGCRADNRICNLRECSPRQNAQNSRLRSVNTSGYKGVIKGRYKEKPWRAQICTGKGGISLGSFATPEEAHAAYCEAAKHYHGEFANFGT